MPGIRRCVGEVSIIWHIPDGIATKGIGAKRSFRIKLNVDFNRIINSIRDASIPVGGQQLNAGIILSFQPVDLNAIV